MAAFIEISDKILNILVERKKQLENVEKTYIKIEDLVEEAILEYFHIDLIELNSSDENVIEFLPFYYVYVYLNPLKIGEFKYADFSFNCEPVYIGIGQNLRYKSHLLHSQNIELEDFLKKLQDNNIQPIIEKIKQNLTKQEALTLENNLIFYIGKKNCNNGPLLNELGGKHLILDEKNIVITDLNIEQNSFLQILKSLNKNKTLKLAAEELKISERTLFRKMKSLNIKKDKKANTYYVENFFIKN
jgi:hypothetical protein